MFGDPDVQGLEYPTQSIKVELGLVSSSESIAQEEKLDVVPNFVAGVAFGEAIGIGIRATSQWLTVENASLSSPSDALVYSFIAL